MAHTKIEAAFWEFHNANPGVYRRLRKLALDLVDRGQSKIGIGMLFEVLRWQHAMTTTGDADGFKLNNNYRAMYARLLMANEPRLAGKFDLRRLHGADEPFEQRPWDAPTAHVAPPRFVADKLTIEGTAGRPVQGDAARGVLGNDTAPRPVLDASDVTFPTATGAGQAVEPDLMANLEASLTPEAIAARTARREASVRMGRDYATGNPDDADDGKPQLW